MDEQTRKALELARKALAYRWLPSTHAKAIAAIDAALSAPAAPVAHSDDLAVDALASAMKAKLADARAKGRSGWETCSPEALSEMLRDHVEKGDPRDVANFCAFLWSLGSGITAPLPGSEAFDRWVGSGMGLQPAPAAPVAQPLTDAYKAAHAAIVGRFTVHKRIGGGVWPYCVRAGTGAQEVFVGHKAKCEEVAQALQTACLDGAYMVAHGIGQGDAA